MDVSHTRSCLDSFNEHRKKLNVPLCLKSGGNFHRASVLLPFAVLENDLKILTTVRHPSIARYPNEISFPGGRFEDEDKDSIGTALREAQEEVGLRPDDITIVGKIDDFISFERQTKNHAKPILYLVSVVVGVLKDGFSLKKSSNEVEEIVFGSVNYMLSSFHIVKFLPYNIPTMALNREVAGHYMYGYSAFILFFVCITSNVVPKNFLSTRENWLTVLAPSAFKKLFPVYILDYLQNKLETLKRSASAQVESKI